jgi:hypothetical protein
MTRPVEVSMRGAAMVAVAMTMMVGCVHTLGRPPTEADLQNDGTLEAQDELYKRYSVTLERGLIKRPGASPELVQNIDKLVDIDFVDAPAWSDDAYNYLSTTEDGAEALETPAVAFDQFNNNGVAPALLLGVGAAVGLVGGVTTWFIPTTLRDGINNTEIASLTLLGAGGMGAGIVLGALLAGTYGLLGPALSGPLATPAYRVAVRAFNDDLEARIAAGATGVEATAQEAPTPAPTPTPVVEETAPSPSPTANAVP